MLRRCTLVWSWPLAALARRALLHMKTAPGLLTAVAKIAIGGLQPASPYVPLVIAALLGSDGSLVGLGLAVWMPGGCCPWVSC